MTKTEAERIAAMGHALRPDWPISSLMTLLAAHRVKAYRDVAVALSWIATDPQTVTPGRLNEQGPWWKATQAGEPTFTVNSTMCPDHPDQRLLGCRPCEETVADVQAGLDRVRAALSEVRR